MATMLPSLSNVVELTQALVRIPSVNPDGDPGTTETGEQACGEFVAAFLERIGAKAVLEEVQPGRPNVIGRFPSNLGADGRKKPCIVFGPHLDTVGVGGMTIEPFSGELRDGRIWGRGASDTKGPMASMLWALKTLGAQAIAELPVEVHFAGFMSEESSQHGSRHFAENHPDYAFALVAEPTSLKTVLKHKGCLWDDVVTTGLAAHGATPEKGVNAITKMAAIIQALDTEFRDLLVELGGVDELLGCSTLNIGMIHGGTRSNIVAAECTLRVDIRTTPALHRAGGAAKLLREFIARTDPTAHTCSVSEAMPLDTSADNPFVKHLVACGAEITGAPWFCDGAFLAAEGIPSIAIGPGSIAQAHTKDEWIDVAELEAGAAFFVNFLRTLRL
ncbi:MAG: Acetylornithine deacetylase [Verrucomicrobiaceae bacterium]|nr:Acetylornithine deacetylase [Verrucomicrobiaceae bacterium]